MVYIPSWRFVVASLRWIGVVLAVVAVTSAPPFRRLALPARATGASCAGDCDGDGAVSIGEVLALVNIALGNASVSECAAGDGNGDGEVTIDEVIRAVHAALNDCPARPTTLMGLLVLPPTSQCPNCSNRVVGFGVIGLIHNAAPVLIRSLQTNSQGRYDTGDLSAALSDPANGSIDTNGDGARTVIVVADVNASGAQIGGVDSIQSGVGAMKNFDVKTQVACVAAVFLTAGTTDPCTVQAECGAGEPDCVVTVDPDVLDDARVSRLEQAASIVSANLVLPDDIGRAACAALICTDGGTTTATVECVRRILRPVP